MKHKLFAFLAGLALLIAAPAHAAGPDDPTGDWFGALRTPQGILNLILTIGRDDKGLTAVLESPDQAPGQKIPVAQIAVDGDTLSFNAKVIGASYTGTWAGDRWQGSFRQGIDLPLEFKRGERAAKPLVAGLDGVWNATLKRNGQEIGVILKVQTADGSTNATFDIPGQMAYGLPVTELKRDGASLHFFVPAANAAYDGTLAADGKSTEGTWARAGSEPLPVSFSFAGDKVAKRQRPQTPKPPFPYRAEDVTFENPAAGGIRLAGTLTLPEGAGPFPAAILISGSGPQDRDETIFDHKPFAVLADSLTRRGIAVLRFDDRGFGASEGEFATATSVDFAADANAAFAYLAHRPGIKADAIGMIGHSEGGLIAPVAAKDNDRIAFMVMLAAPGTPTLQLLQSQRRLIALSQGVPEDAIAKSEALMAEPLNAIKAAPDQAAAKAALETLLTDERLAALGIPPAQKTATIGQYSNGWFRFFIRYDPADWVPGLKMPILAIGGTLDLQVPADENLPGLKALLKGNADATVAPVNGLNHLFQHANTGALSEYAEIEETFAPEALALIGDWIGRRF